MAEIDKALPNVKQTVNIPGPQEVELEQQEHLKEQVDAGKPIDVQENEIIYFNENPIYNKWTKNKKNFYLLNYVLPTEDIEDVKIINSNIDTIDQYNFKKIVQKYDFIISFGTARLAIFKIAKVEKALPFLKVR